MGIKNRQARSFVTIMLVVAISALSLRILITQLLKINIEQNQSNAQATLKLISAALENFAKDNHGLFPANFSLLTQSSPPYLDKDYIAASPFKGYNYTCLRLEASGYSCSAGPAWCKLTGSAVYTITSGGLLLSEECSQKE